MSHTPPPPYSEHALPEYSQCEGPTSHVVLNPPATHAQTDEIDVLPTETSSFVDSKADTPQILPAKSSTRTCKKYQLVEVNRLNLEILKDSCQTADGGRYVVNSKGVIEHMSNESYIAYQKKRKMVIIGAVIATIIFIILCVSGSFLYVYLNKEPEPVEPDLNQRIQAAYAHALEVGENMTKQIEARNPTFFKFLKEQRKNSSFTDFLGLPKPIPVL